MCLHEPCELAEARMPGIMKDRVQHGLAREQVGAVSRQRFETDLGITTPSRTDAVNEDCDLEAGGDGTERGLKDANGGFDTGEQEVANRTVGEECGVEAFVGQGRKGGLGPHGRSGGEGKHGCGGGAELLRDLLGEGHGQAERPGAGDSELAAAQDLGAVRDRGQERGLQVQAEQESVFGRRGR